MKIAVIGVKGLPANQGGIEHYCQALYPKMVERGHSVDLYARSSYVKKPWFSVYKSGGVRIICLPSLPIRGLDALTNSGLAAFVSIFNNYDIVHFHALGPSLFSVIPRLLSRAKVIATCQGLDWQRGKWGNFSSQIIHLGEKAAAKYSHQMIVVSQALDNYFQKTYGIAPVYIPNGPGIYEESDSNFSFVKSFELTPKKYFLFLGRLVPEKRPDLLIEAFCKANSQGWKLVLAGGDSDTTEYINKLYRLANKNPDIIFVGELKGRFLAEMVRGAGLFVLPSDLEGLPLAMLEAMREGIPALASDIEPHQQLIGSDRGFLFKAGNVDSCAAALQKIVLDLDKLLSIAKNAQKHVQTHYNWDKITSENLAVYNSSLNNLIPEQKDISKLLSEKLTMQESQKTILVTGGAGYIGSHTVKALQAEGYRVIVLDNLVYGHQDLVEDVLQAELIVGDIKDRPLLDKIFATYPVEAVIHFAAYAYVGESVNKPAKYYFNNVLGTLTLLEAMRSASIKKIVFSSTCATYGIPSVVPVPEDHPQNPINPYGKSKLMVEKLLEDFDLAYGLKSVCFRYFNAAGADPEGVLGEDHDPETHLIPLVLQTALGMRESISIFGTDYPTDDGTCIRDYIHVSDLAQAHVMGLKYLLKGNQSEIFNLGNGNGFSVREIIQAAKEVTKKEIKVQECDRRAGDPPILVGGSEKARKVLHWNPQYSDIRQIIAHAWHWHQQRHQQKVVKPEYDKQLITS